MLKRIRGRLVEIALGAAIVIGLITFGSLVHEGIFGIAVDVRIRAEGRAAAIQGVSDAGNPYVDYVSRRWWLEGWIEGKRDRPPSAVGGEG